MILVFVLTTSTLIRRLACLLQDGCLSISSAANVETDPAPSNEELYDSHLLSKIIHTPKLQYTHPQYSLHADILCTRSGSPHNDLHSLVLNYARQ